MEIIMSKKREFKNKALKASTARIRKAGDSVRVNVYRIARELAKIHNEKLWIDDGYEDVADYANKVLHIKKTTCYDLIKIGNTFVADSGTKSNLARPDGCKNDYGFGQLRVLLPIGYEKAEELAGDGVISPDMSVRQIKRIARFNDENAIELTSEIPRPPEAVFTVADGNIFTTDYFSSLERSQIEEIIKICTNAIAANKEV